MPDIFDEVAEAEPAKDIFDEVAAESATRDIFDEVAAEIPARPAPVSSPFSVPPAAPYSPGRESSELGLYDLRVPKEFQPTPIRTPGILETLTTGLPLRPFSIGQQLESIAKGQDFGGGVKSEGIPALRVPAGIVKGGENVATGAMQFMTSPAGIATMGLSAAPAIVRSLASAGFAADMARHAPDAYQKFEEARLAGDDMGQAEALTEGLGTLAMSGLAGSHSYATAREVILSNRAKPSPPVETAPAATERAAAPIPERETPTPPQQQGAAPTEVPVVPETVAPAGPTTAGPIRSAIASDRLDWFAKTGKEPTVLEIRPDEVGDLPKLGRLLTDNAATRGLNESETKRVTALEDTQTGEVHLVSTYRERSSGTVRLVQPDRADSKRPNVALQRLPGRYVPIASFLLTEPVKNLHESFPDRASYDAAKEQLTEARQAQESLRATAEEMPAVQGDVTEPVMPREAITDEGAAGIHDVFGGAPDVADVAARFDTLVKSTPTAASELVRRELRQVAEKMMDEDPSLTPQAAALKLKDWLYENTRPEIDRQEFIRRATGLGQPRGEVARAEATTQAKPTAQPELTGKPVSETVSKPSAAETITGREERTGSEMPAEREERPRRTASTTERPHDLIDELEGSVGKIDPALIREADPNWKPIGAARKLFRRGGIAADKALNDITYDGPKLGLAQDTPLDAFGEALNAAASARKQFRGAERRNEQQIIREGKQGEQFRKRVLQGERPKAQAENVEQVPVEGLVEGDTFKVQDHEFTVRRLEFDEDLNLVGITVKDGPKFGVQTIRPGQEVIHIDKGTFQPVPREQWPAVEPPEFSLDKPESVAEQQRRTEAEAERQAARERTAQIAEGQAKPLVGSVGDIGQADLLGGGDLFSGRRTEPPLGGALMVGVDPVATARAVVRLVTAARQNETVDRITRQLGGHSAPITMAAADASGEALIRFASARGTGKLMGRAKAAEVLGDKFKDEAFREKLGAVIVEDQLRATKAKFQKMADREPDPALKAEYQEMADAAGRLGSPFKSNAEFRKALADPEILAALERHKEIVQPIAEEAHRMLGGKMMEAGETTGTFANLIAILGEEPVQKAFGGGKGDLTRPRKRPSRFFFERKGTAEKYETDYEKIASRMIEGNFDEVAKRELYGQLETDGLAVTLRPGLPAPEIGGKKTQKFEVQRRGTPAGTQTENLWVREDVARELRQALDVDGPVARAGWVRAAAIGNAIQLAGPTDAFFHVANMLSSISRSQGGRNMLVDLGRKLPGVNVADTIARVAASAKRVIQDSPEIRKRIAELSDIGAMRPLREFGPSEGIRRFIPHELGGRFIQLLDVAGRLVREDLFNNLVRRGLVEDTPANRREWINQLGQYNPRLMPQFQRLMRDFGVSPFVVAGRNFNRNAIRSLLLSQGVKASSPTAWAKMKAVDVAGMALTIFGIAAFINYLTTGNPNGRPGTKVGEIDTGKGTLKIDPLQWTGLRRGMRITGIDALTSGSRWNSSDRETKRRAGVDIVNGILHPWAGPVPKALSIATTGYGSLGFKESKNPEDFGQNLLAAVEQLNPVARSVLKGWEGAEETGMSKPGAAILETGKSLSGALGVKSRRITSAVQQLRGLHEDWALKHPEPKVRQRAATNAQTSFGPSHYQPLDKAIATGDKALIRKAYIALVRAGNSERDIWDRFSPITASGRERTLFNESEELESQFFGSLKPEQRRLYGEAMRDWYRRFGLFQDATGIFRRPRD